MSASPRSEIIEEVVGSLCDQIDAAEDKAERWRQELIDAKRALGELRMAHSAAIEALRPFAQAGADISEFWDGERLARTLSIEAVRVRHYRRAAALVQAADTKPA